jgi:hypothetical protein
VALILSIQKTKNNTMKRVILLTVALISISVASFAQFRLGIKGGANLSKVSGKSFNEEFDLGYQLGAFSEIGLGGNLGIQPEVLFSQVNAKRSSGFNSIYQGLASNNSNDEIKLHYLSIPILLRYNVSKLVTLHAGPEFSALIDHDENLLQNGEKAFSNGDFAVVGGLQLNLKRLRVYGRYNVGLNNINDIDEKDKWKNQQIQLGLGVKL